ncbi:acylneuraminate cytidylyltransferase family protein [Desulfoplanes sp. PS50]|jgi:N-acylneuraminate cytidylyltransferase
MDTKQLKTWGFIFARGGSKGVPGKNIKSLAGKPLIAHAIETGLKSGVLERIIVSTDDQRIADVALEYGAEVPFLRPRELAGDTSAEWDAWRHAISSLPPFDVFVSLPATAPLRAPEDIVACIEMYKQNSCDAVITCRPAARHPSFNMISLDNENKASLLMPLSENVFRRQDAPAAYDMTTVAYVVDPEFIMSKRSLFEGVVRAVVIPEERALDIDTPLDFKFAEFLIAREEYGKRI